MLNITWGEPYRIKEGSTTLWRREWCIPKDMLSGFFEFWKRNKFKLLADGFSVIKSKTGKWYLHETKPNKSLFKVFGDLSSKPEDDFILPPYKVKDISGLKPWQIKSVEKLCSSIKIWGSGIDGSECGVGKTYSAIAVARELGLKICVICPKAVVSAWEDVITNHFGMKDKIVGITNYEKLIRGRKDSPIASFSLPRHSKRKIFKWKLPKRTLIIWDESQKLKNWKTQNAKRCVDAIKDGYPMIFCSATNATNPLEMRAVGLALKLYKNGNAYYHWAKEHGVYQGIWGLEFNNDPKILKKLHKIIFEQRGIRYRRDDIPNFPECEVIPKIYNMDKENITKINNIHKEMKKEIKIAEKREKLDADKAKKLNKQLQEVVIQLRARQKIELIKVPLFVEMIEDALDQGFSVAVFINFTETLTAIAERLKTKCIFDGKTADKVREENKNKFLNDVERVILINIQSGGPGLNLHDLKGNFPRMSIISPSHSPVLMRQALGRIWRVGAKTKGIQYIVCVSNTVEENVYNNVQKKLNNLDMLNDGDLSY